MRWRVLLRQQLLQLLMFGAKLGVILTQPRRNGAINRIQVEFVPARIDLHLGRSNARVGEGAESLARRFLLPLERAGVHGAELHLLRRQIFAQQTSLYAAQVGQRVVIVAQTGLAVPNQVERAQPNRSANSTAARIRPRTRRWKSRKRSSRVWPR